MNIAGLLCSAFAVATLEAGAEEPWRLSTAVGAPEWFSISGSYRIRYETLNHPFRAAASGDQILVQRFGPTSTTATRRWEPTTSMPPNCSGPTWECGAGTCSLGRPPISTLSSATPFDEGPS